MLSDIAGDVKRCVDAKEKYIAGLSSKNYSDFYFQRVKEECAKTIPKSALSEINDEIRSLEDYLNGKVDADYVLRYWKPYEYAHNPYEAV
jgi:hypothetical protein